MRFRPVFPGEYRVDDSVTHFSAPPWSSFENPALSVDAGREVITIAFDLDGDRYTVRHEVQGFHFVAEEGCAGCRYSDSAGLPVAVSLLGLLMLFQRQRARR